MAGGEVYRVFPGLQQHLRPGDHLRPMYETILEQQGVVGLSIATRPDCLPDDVVDYLAELNSGPICGWRWACRRSTRRRPG